MNNLTTWQKEFLSLSCNRAEILHKTLISYGIASQIVELAGGLYVIAHPKNNLNNSFCRQKIITAHHDRVPGTTGALDNSAACFQLVDFLASGVKTLNTVVIFTDREELGSANPTEQGSFCLGSAFSFLKFDDPLVFVLDVTGSGDTIVISNSAKSLKERAILLDSACKETNSISKEIDTMSSYIEKILRPDIPFCRAEIPFGEDLGFFLAGVPALVTTVLPFKETLVLNNCLNDGEYALPSWAKLDVPESKMPLTWKYLHSQGDTVALYNDSAFFIMKEFIKRLGELRIKHN